MNNLNQITIYTTSDYPYGGPAENFVRQMALGLKENGQSVSIVLLKGQSKKQKNDTNIQCLEGCWS